MPRRTRPKGKMYPPKRYPHMRPPRMAPGTNYAMRGMVDMQKMAVAGAIGAGTIGIVGSLFKP